MSGVVYHLGSVAAHLLNFLTFVYIYIFSIQYKYTELYLVIHLNHIQDYNL